MSGSTIPSATPTVGAFSTAPDPEFDARWNAWVAHGLASERATMARMRFIAPAVAVCAVAALYLLTR